jgi:pilus assembly protein CpaD
MFSSRQSLPARSGAASAVLRVAVAGCALALAGCNMTRQDIAASVPNDYRMRHPIVVKEGDRTVELFVGRSRGGLSPAQRADVLNFGEVWRREATGGVAIDLPTGTPNARAAADALREIRSILLAAGVPPRGLVVRPYRPADPAQLATVKLSYSKIVAEAGPCGLWPQDIGPSWTRTYFENQQYWNLGCATQRNLAAVVDNPADLVQPRGETPPMAGRRSVVLDKYRRGEGTATQYPDANKGKISDIGQ